MVKVTQLSLAMSNACLISGEKHILVDTGSPGELGRIEAKLKKLGLSLPDLSLVLLTHAHFDHAGNAAAIKRRAGCPLAVHALDRPCMESGKNAAIVPLGPMAALISPFMKFPFAPAGVDIVPENGFDLSPFGVEARVLFTPGHTPGSVSVLTANGEAIVGDLVGGGWPLGQFQPSRPRFHYWASSLADVHASLEALFASPVNKIYVGHGGPLDGQEARRFFQA